ncbi:MAG: immunoglobulin domain-containing protein [Verrucomicrobiia bacterium]
MSKPVATKLIAASAVLLLMAAGSYRAEAQKNVVQPGDALIASSSNNPGSEGVANAIDGTQAKYLNFDNNNNAKSSGFVVTPSVGPTILSGIAMQSANDAPERDPLSITLEGSNDETIADFASGSWTLIYKNESIPAWGARYETKTFNFENYAAYKHYRWTVLLVQNAPSTANSMQIAEVQLLGATVPKNVLQPSDPIVASSSNNPGSEGVANAIDGTQAKYLNFDNNNNAKPSGFVVTPSVGSTLVTGMSIQSANDAPERDPLSVTLEGSNDDTIADFASGNWTLIYKNESIPAWSARYETKQFFFPNYQPYKHYRWTVVLVQNAPSTANSMQIAEVELLGTGAPKNALQPSDPLIASSSNNPGSEGVANAIDGTQAKYLNFDNNNNAKPSGFVVTPSVGPTTIVGLAMQSANDAPERDPLSVTLEGSNDDTIADFASGNWTLIYKNESIPAWSARYETKTFYFPNTASYKHYRWTVNLVQNAPSTANSMQIAEVELLAVTTETDCSKAQFLVQPVNTPVLSGSSATFFVTVNGPWPLQWYRGDTAIPGATGTSYTTGPITSANADDVYTVQIVGCEASTPAKAVLFTPSATKSIGVSFRGGGANGAPTLMLPEDIAGIHPQAYWVNAPDAGSGSLPFDTTDADGNPVTIGVVNSDNQPSDIVVEWTTSGTWGSGTGDSSPTQRMLNGLVHDQAGGDPASVMFYNVPSGTHAVIAYVVGIPLQFQDSDYTVIGQTTQTINVRVLSSDEYKAAPGFYRGVSTDPNNRSLATYVRFDNVRADASGMITLQWSCLTSGYDRGTPVNAVQLILNATAPGAPPVITGQPQPTVVAEGGTARISVAATGEGLTYQWLKEGRSLPNGGNVSGATSPILTITDFSEDDEAVYSVAIFNAGGSTDQRHRHGPNIQVRHQRCPGRVLEARRIERNIGGQCHYWRSGRHRHRSRNLGRREGRQRSDV